MEVGNPVRDAVKAVMAAPNFHAWCHRNEPIRLLIFGGSQGASLFSAAPPEVIAALPEQLRARLDCHASGARE